MSTKKELNVSQPTVAESEDPDASTPHESRKPTLAENTIVTIKILAGFGLLGTAIWAIDLWVTR